MCSKGPAVRRPPCAESVRCMPMSGLAGRSAALVIVFSPAAGLVGGAGEDKRVGVPPPPRPWCLLSNTTLPDRERVIPGHLLQYNAKQTCSSALQHHVRLYLPPRTPLPLTPYTAGLRVCDTSVSALTFLPVCAQHSRSDSSYHGVPAGVMEERARRRPFYAAVSPAAGPGRCVSPFRQRFLCVTVSPAFCLHLLPGPACSPSQRCSSSTSFIPTPHNEHTLSYRLYYI